MWLTRDEIRWKGFRRGFAPADVLLCASESAVKKSPVCKPQETRDNARPDVIAIRKTCDAEGTGLSHYVLMDRQVKR
jgi:modified peptide precursor CbpA